MLLNVALCLCSVVLEYDHASADEGWEKRPRIEGIGSQLLEFSA